MSGSAQKRKRVVLTIESKIKIIERFQCGEKIAKLADEYEVGNTTVRDIIKNREKILQFASTADSSSGLNKRKAMKESTFSSLDSCLFEWFQQKRAEGVPISGVILSQQAQIFHKKLGLTEEFVASRGWLSRFKTRHGIRELTLEGEKLSGDSESADLFKKEFQRIIDRHGFMPDQVYNADESGLYWKCLPSKTLASSAEKSAPGHKSSKERITIMCCANASGEHKLKLLCVGKAKNPRSFKGTEMKHFPVHYYHNKSAWMTREIFKSWFHSKFVPQVTDFLKSKGLPVNAVLFLDNAPSHPHESELTSADGKIFVSYLPPNVTALIQPMDQGVIVTLKRHFRRELLSLLLEEDTAMVAFWKNMKLKEAIYLVAKAWGMITKLNLIRSWRKIYCDIENSPDIFHGFENEDSETEPFPDTIRTSLQNNVQFASVDEENIQEWLNTDLELPGYQVKSDDDIILHSNVSAGATDDSCSEDEGEEEELIPAKRVTHQTALEATETLLHYLEQEDCEFPDVLTLRRIRLNIKQQINKSKQRKVTDFFKKAN